MTVYRTSSPVLIPEIAQLVCSFVAPGDLLNVAYSCKTLFYAARRLLWREVHPKTARGLRRLRYTLRGPSAQEYRRLVWRLWLDSPVDDLNDGCLVFPNLEQVHVSWPMAEDSTMRALLSGTSRLRHANLSHCYRLSTAAIQPLCQLPADQLQSLILYGSKFDAAVLVAILERHAHSLSCVRLTDVEPAVLLALRRLTRLRDLGLEHCSSGSQIHLLQNDLARLCLRDVRAPSLNNITATQLVHLDISECHPLLSIQLEQLAERCPRLESLSLVFQFSATDRAIQVRLNKLYIY